MNNLTIRETDILRSLRSEKKKIGREIRKSQGRISASARDIFGTVPKAGNHFANVSNLVGNGMAIYQGVRIGTGLIKAVRSMLRLRRR